MSRKIATPAAVFAACDRLEATGDPWNRDDVRQSVGGGGWSVIDPLIRTWRELKPVKAIASSTPTQLLHQIAATLEAHFSDFTDDVEQRDRDRSQIFERTVAELSEHIATLDHDAREKRIAVETLEGKCDRLTNQLEDKSKTLHDKERQLSVMQAENDELRGQTSRLDKQLQERESLHTKDRQALETKFQLTLSTLTKEHKADLEKQKADLLHLNEQSENRLMRLIDRERSDGKQEAEKLTQQLAESRQKEQVAIGQSIKQQTCAQRFQDRVDDLDMANRKLHEDLAMEQANQNVLVEELQFLRRANENSRTLEELQTTILDLKKNIG